MEYKLIMCIVLVALAAAHFASALKCYECATLTECQKPKVETCNESSANRTTKVLQGSFLNVKDMKSTNFDCLGMNLTDTTNKTVNEIRGCVYRELDACSLTLMGGYGGKQCKLCSGDLCNGNPAAKSTISFLTVCASVLAAITVKMLAH